TADHLGVGEISWNFDVLETLAHPHAGAELVRPVRLMETHPEAERLAGGALLEKSLEVAGVVVGVNARRRRLQFLLIEAGAGGIALAAGAGEIARSPAFAG